MYINNSTDFTIKYQVHGNLFEDEYTFIKVFNIRGWCGMIPYF